MPIGGTEADNRITLKTTNHKCSGSAFDTTKAPIKERPGAHGVNKLKPETSAFSTSKDVVKPNPRRFLKKGCGTGGLSGKDAISKQVVDVDVDAVRTERIENRKKKFQMRSSLVQTRQTLNIADFTSAGIFQFKWITEASKMA